MKLRIIILLLTQILISDLSFAQTDLLKGKQVTVHFHKTKRAITGEFRSYKNNRVTVLFDMSLHDYFYTEVKSLESEGLNFSFDENGKLIFEKVEYTIITLNDIYYGFIISEDDSEILLETKSIGKIYIRKAEIKVRRKS